MTEITIDELETYMYCGEYYRAYINGKVPLYSNRKPINVILTAGIKWLLAYKAKTQLVPEEDDVIIAVAKMIARAETHGFKLESPTKINDIHLALLKFRASLSNEKIESWNQVESVLEEDIRLLFTMPLITNKRVAFFSEDTYRNTRKKISFLIPLAYLYTQIENDRPIYIYCIDDGQIREYQIDLEDFRMMKISYFSHRMKKGIREGIYKPIYNCTTTSCSNWKECKPY